MRWLRWRLLECSDFSPNDKDKKSYNAIAMALEAKLDEDALAQKLMLVLYMFLQERRKLTIFDDDDKFIQEELFKYCERDLGDIVKEFGYKNNIMIMGRLFDELAKEKKTHKEVSVILRELSIDLEPENLRKQIDWMYLELKKKLSWN